MIVALYQGKTQIFEGYDNHESIQPRFVCPRDGNDGPWLALKQCIGPTKVAQRTACGNLDTGLGSRGLSRWPKGKSLGTCRQGRCQFRREWQGALDDHRC